MKNKFSIFLIFTLFLSASAISVESFSWDSLRISYHYNYSSYDSYLDILVEYNLSVENVLVKPDIISYDVDTDQHPRYDYNHIQNVVDTKNNLLLYEIYDTNSYLLLGMHFNLTLDLEELGHHFYNAFFIPINNPSFSFKNDYSDECNFTYDTSFEIYNRTETGYFVHLEYISTSVPTYSVKELIYTENGELFRHYQSSNTVFNSTFSYFTYSECILEASSRTSANTKRVSMLGLFSLSVIILIVVIIKRKNISVRK